jgi:hypothetical protein
VVEVSGSSATPALDGANAGPATGISWSKSATVGTTGDKLFGFGGFAAAPVTYTAGAGFTLIDNGSGTARAILEWSTSTVSSGSQAALITPSASADGTMVVWAMK